MTTGVATQIHLQGRSLVSYEQPEEPSASSWWFHLDPPRLSAPVHAVPGEVTSQGGRSRPSHFLPSKGLLGWAVFVGTLLSLTDPSPNLVSLSSPPRH